MRIVSDTWVSEETRNSGETDITCLWGSGCRLALSSRQEKVDRTFVTGIYKRACYTVSNTCGTGLSRVIVIGSGRAGSEGTGSVGEGNTGYALSACSSVATCRAEWGCTSGTGDVVEGGISGQASVTSGRGTVGTSLRAWLTDSTGCVGESSGWA